LSGTAQSYSVYGLSVRSPLTLPCPRVGNASSADVDLGPWRADRLEPAHAEAVSGRDSRSWFRCRRLSDGTTYLRWRGLFEFLVSSDGRRIRYHRLDRATEESLGVYLLGQVLSCSLVAFGIEPLHGTVVTIGRSAVALLGDCGYGKSTLAAALLAHGGRILSDDVVALAERNGRWTVQPGVPRLKLFPSVAKRLLGPAARGAPMNRATVKMSLPLGPADSARAPATLAALYVLSDPAKRPPSPRPRVETLVNGEAFLEVTRAFFNLLALDRQRRANQFALATRAALSLPVRRLIYPRKLASLPEVCDAILEDLTRTA
jgi:hypothetical protein